MEATVFQSGHDFFVSLTLAGEEVDVAGPFDDLADAELASLRCVPRFPRLEDFTGSGSWNGGRYLSRRDRLVRAA